MNPHYETPGIRNEQLANLEKAILEDPYLARLNRLLNAGYTRTPVKEAEVEVFYGTGLAPELKGRVTSPSALNPAAGEWGLRPLESEHELFLTGIHPASLLVLKHFPLAMKLSEIPITTFSSTRESAESLSQLMTENTGLTPVIFSLLLPTTEVIDSEEVKRVLNGFITQEEFPTWPTERTFSTVGLIDPEKVLHIDWSN